jgi:signal transduction histidine kinase
MDERPPVVLVVDDEEWMRDACAIVLGREGMEVLAATGAAAGLELAAARKPDVVLVDVRMPGMSGIDFLTRVKEIDPDVVGIVITGYATIDVAVRAMKAGALEFLPKPFAPEQLRDLARRGVEHRRAIRRTALLGPEVAAVPGVRTEVLAHQLKSPLASLRQCASAVLHGYTGELPEQAHGMVEVIARRADQMLGLIDDWITLVRLEQGGAPSIREAVELNALLERLLERAAKRPDAAGRALALGQAAGGATVQGDAELLAELFGKLVANAFHRTPVGGEVRVEVRREAAAVTVRIFDGGPGIAEAERERVFEPFYRGAAQRAVAGDGLTLPIARRIAAAHGGGVAVGGESGRGAVLTVVLPTGA